MQVISGIHFNYSMPDKFWPAWQEINQLDLSTSELKSTTYLGLVRNVRRLDWLLLYLFGASPAVCASFLNDASTKLKKMGNGTYFGPTATSLRMSDIGYQNSNQAALHVSANSLDEYIDQLSAAVATPNPDYQKMGVKNGDTYLQLNANQLQIENEYYSTIRPKRVANSGERPTAALRRAGIEYVELRALDISPFDPVGISQCQQNFLEAFLIYALLVDSPPINKSEQEQIRQNQLLVARSGREQGLTLQRDGQEVFLRDWALEICEEMEPICELLDANRCANSGADYSSALARQTAAVNDADQTPSARLLHELDQSRLEFADFGLAAAEKYRDYFIELDDSTNQHAELFAQEAQDSIDRQHEIEAQDQISLDAYIEQYYS